jgi:hypothetical protein
MCALYRQRRPSNSDRRKTYGSQQRDRIDWIMILPELQRLSLLREVGRAIALP